jgi:site-specific DNA-methyltransferase (adenine-specific)
VLKPTGSLYLHCDPTASHYLKLLLDAVFGTESFRNEITWKRTFAHGNVGRNYGSIADILFFYTKGDNYCWNQPYSQLTEEEIEEKYPFVDTEGRRWQSVTLRNPGQRPNLHFPYTASNGVTYEPHPNGWSCNLERLQRYDREGRLHLPSKPGGALRLKMYADESPGERLQNIWEDIAPIGANAAERLGYPTQKPVALLERILKTSSNPGDLVLDPFCGCGTTIDAAEKLGRHWIGIDITQLAVTLIKNRLLSTYGSQMKFISGPAQGRAGSPLPAVEGGGKSEAPDGAQGTAHPTESVVRIIGEPTTPNEAYVLAEQDKFQFQWWALGLVGARPVEQKKGADHGIDGKILFRDDPRAAKPEQIIIQVKGGKTGVKDVRDLRGVLEREKAGMGLLISLQPPTKDMVAEAVSAGFYEHRTNQQRYPRLQLRTVKELMEGKGIERPSTVAALDETFKKAPKAKAKGHEQHDLGL